jgi:hypothetical protein
MPASFAVSSSRVESGGEFGSAPATESRNDFCDYALLRIVARNWLFVGSDDAGAVNALFTSVLASCQLCSVQPWSYLRDILSLLPRWPEHRLLQLAALHRAKTRELDDVRRLLDENRFRRLTRGRGQQLHPRSSHPVQGMGRKLTAAEGIERGGLLPP